MTQINYRFFFLFIGIFFISANGMAQTVNFDETWKEFLDNNKISNMSALDKPSKSDDPLNYIRYLLMNTNNSFCQSEVAKAEELVAEINRIDVRAHQAVPGFIKKLEDLEAKIKAYHSMDEIWKQFLKTRTVNLDALNAVKAAKTSCEKSTLAKYSYMTVFAHYCGGNISKAKDILENRTLRLTEKTSLRVEDVEGLGTEIAKMKSLFQNISKLETNWENYMKTGVSPGFNIELPLFPCNPIPNMKELVLKGAVDVCNSGPAMLEKIRKLQSESGVTPDGTLAKKITELEAAIKQNEDRLAVLNKAWEKFLPNNELKKADRKYGYEYCTREPLIRAYVMDGFVNICGVTEEGLQEIEDLQKSKKIALADITMTKIRELRALHRQYQVDATDINQLWNKFIAQGDRLDGDYRLADYYCDNIYDVKAWIIKGFAADCKEGGQYLEQIDEVKRALEFEFAYDIKCRVEKLRFRLWDCKYQALKKLAIIQTSPDAFEEKLEALVEEYGIGPRPEVCSE